MSNPIWSLYLRASMSVKFQKTTFVPDIPLMLAKFYFYIKHSINPNLTQDLIFFIPKVKLYFLIKKRLKQPTHPLSPLIMNNSCPYRISAAAGTAFARTSFFFYCHYLQKRKGFTTSWAFITHLILLDQAVAHCPIFPTAASYLRAWAVSQSQCGCTFI